MLSTNIILLSITINIQVKRSGVKKKNINFYPIEQILNLNYIIYPRHE